MHGLPSPGGEHKFGAWRSLDVSFSSLPIYLVRRMYKINHNLVRFTSVLVVSLVHSWADHLYTSGVCTIQQLVHLHIWEARLDRCKHPMYYMGG